MRYYLLEIHSISEEYSDEDEIFLKIDFSYSNCGHIERTTRFWYAKQWEKIADKGYFEE